MKNKIYTFWSKVISIILVPALIISGCTCFKQNAYADTTNQNKFIPSKVVKDNIKVGSVDSVLSGYYGIDGLDCKDIDRKGQKETFYSYYEITPKEKGKKFDLSSDNCYWDANCFFFNLLSHDISKRVQDELCKELNKRSELLSNIDFSQDFNSIAGYLCILDEFIFVGGVMFASTVPLFEYILSTILLDSTSESVSVFGEIQSSAELINNISSLSTTVCSNLNAEESLSASILESDAELFMADNTALESSAISECEPILSTTSSGTFCEFTAAQTYILSLLEISCWIMVGVVIALTIIVLGYGIYMACTGDAYWSDRVEKIGFCNNKGLVNIACNKGYFSQGIQVVPMYDDEALGWMEVDWKKWDITFDLSKQQCNKIVIFAGNNEENKNNAVKMYKDYKKSYDNFYESIKLKMNNTVKCGFFEKNDYEELKNIIYDSKILNLGYDYRNKNIKNYIYMKCSVVSFASVDLIASNITKDKIKFYNECNKHIKNNDYEWIVSEVKQNT